MTKKLLTLVVSVVALGALAGVGYAVSSATNAPYRPMMGAGGGYSMMGAGGTRSAWYLAGSSSVTTIEQARAQAQLFADELGLKVGEVIQFTNNFYVRLDDAAGKPATEVLVDPRTGDVTLEYGPAMMWNTKYGMMSGTAFSGPGGMMGRGPGGMMGGTTGGTWGGRSGGMMGGGMMGAGMMGSSGATPCWTPSGVSGPVDAAQARALADKWLAAQGAGLAAGDVDAFPGYFTFETVKGGKIAGMLSVNAGTGALFYHWWHGTFVAEG
jgi:hypothetical protein